MPSSQTTIGVRMCWAIGICLACEFALFAIVKLVLHAAESELVGPYLAFAVPTVITILLAWRLRRWETPGLSPKWLALGWGLCAALFVSMLTLAAIYTGVKIHLINTSDLDVWGIACAICILSAFVTVYRGAYRVLLKRA
jgi:hypothetical protein